MHFLQEAQFNLYLFIFLTGSCEGTLSCSTCHLIIDPEFYDKIEDPLNEEEMDMLDLAAGVTDT